MTAILLRLFIKKCQLKVGLAGYDILFAYFVVEVKSKNIEILPSDDILVWKSFKIDFQSENIPKQGCQIFTFRFYYEVGEKYIISC